MDKINEIVDSILDHFTLPGDTVLPSGQTVRERVKSHVYDLIDSIESELEYEPPRDLFSQMPDPYMGPM